MTIMEHNYTHVAFSVPRLVQTLTSSHKYFDHERAKPQTLKLRDWYLVFQAFPTKEERKLLEQVEAESRMSRDKFFSLFPRPIPFVSTQNFNVFAVQMRTYLKLM